MRLVKMTFPVVKRVLDVIGSGMAILFFMPILSVIAFLVRRDGGPALYADQRVGLHGTEFGCLKFRSMVLNGSDVLSEHLRRNPVALEEWNATQKLKNDPRITRIGRFLRKTSLDELPQFINVLKGDMSLIGPRPVGKKELKDRYGKNARYYKLVRPGITGPWQISGRSKISYERRVMMDVEYCRNPSYLKDTKIIIATPAAVIFLRGAY
jgi:lipopolysaccharide/colanic/teichoic acid biosynthesis glycosyltransferase